RELVERARPGARRVAPGRGRPALPGSPAARAGAAPGHAQLSWYPWRMRALVVFLGLAAACDGLGQDYYTEEGECEAPADSTALGGTPATVFDPGCLIDAFVDLRIVESEAEWQALFNCPQPVPQGIDLVADRA